MKWVASNLLIIKTLIMLSEKEIEILKLMNFIKVDENIYQNVNTIVFTNRRKFSVDYGPFTRNCEDFYDLIILLHIFKSFLKS